MNQPIAIAGIACGYPDANNPAKLWETMLACGRWHRHG